MILARSFVLKDECVLPAADEGKQPETALSRSTVRLIRVTVYFVHDQLFIS